MMKRFFIICQPGTEKHVLQELDEVFPFLKDSNFSQHMGFKDKVELQKGGIELTTEEHLGYQLNYSLKTATRVLMRMGDFKATGFSEFKTKIKKLLPQEFILREFKLASHKSRLWNEDKLKEEVQSLSNKKGSPLSLFVRFLDDRCEVSVDTTGEALYKRGYKQMNVEAPIRETWASLFLQMMTADVHPSELSRVQLLDVFCGSGTILLEANNLFDWNRHRSYAFEEFTFCPKFLKLEKKWLNFKPWSFSFGEIAGSDISKKAVSAAVENCKSVGIQVQKLDALQLNFEKSFPLKENIRSRWLFSNIPYGERVAGVEMKQLKAMIEKSKAQKFGFVMSENQNKEFSDLMKDTSYKLETFHFSNGGMPCVFVCSQRVDHGPDQ